VRKIFRPKREKVGGGWKKIIMRKSMIVPLTRYIMDGEIKEGEMCIALMRRRKLHTEFCLGILKKRNTSKA
jgi:hypothetical protein